MPDKPAELTDYGERLMRTVARDASNLRQARANLWRSVGAAREAGVPWRIIGAALGVSRQAAQERFSKPPAGELF